MSLSGPIEDLVKKLNKLPTIGEKTATRLAYYIMNMEEKEVKSLCESILKVKLDIKECSICHNFTDRDPCNICLDTLRDESTICVVESPKDVEVMERVSGFRGKYHVLHGALSPIKGVDPEDIKLKELLERVKDDKEIKEIIVATNPNVDGDATAMYIAKLFRLFDIKVTRIGYGLPVGGDLVYYDEVTISTALENRREI